MSITGIAYKVQPTAADCQNCGRGQRFDVVGPDDVAESVSFDDEEDAQSYADALNAAYGKGRAETGTLALLRRAWEEGLKPEVPLEAIERCIYCGLSREHSPTCLLASINRVVGTFIVRTS